MQANKVVLHNIGKTPKIFSCLQKKVSRSDKKHHLDTIEDFSTKRVYLKLQTIKLTLDEIFTIL